MRVLIHITQKGPDNAVTRVGAGTLGSWIEYVLQHLGGGPQLF
jgi:hypothetical protein